jgi:hypothetical protein
MTGDRIGRTVVRACRMPLPHPDSHRATETYGADSLSGTFFLSPIAGSGTAETHDRPMPRRVASASWAVRLRRACHFHWDPSAPSADSPATPCGGQRKRKTRARNNELPGMRSPRTACSRTQLWSAGAVPVRGAVSTLSLRTEPHRTIQPGRTVQNSAAPADHTARLHDGHPGVRV